MKQNMPIALIDASPALQEAVNKKTNIQLKLRELENERAALQTKINEDAGSRDKSSHIMSEAEMIVSGGVDLHRDFSPRMDTLDKQIRTLRQALDLQEKEAQSVRSKEGARLGGEYQSTYRERCRRIAALLQELALALEAEYEFRRAVVDADYPTHSLGEIFAIPWLGRPGDDHSNINRLLNSARKHGLLS